MDELEVGQDGGDAARAGVLEEEGLRVEDVEGVAVGKLHGLEGALLRENLVNVRSDEGVGRREGLTEGALDGGFEFLLRGGLESLTEEGGGWVV